MAVVSFMVYVLLAVLAAFTGHSYNGMTGTGETYTVVENGHR